MTNTSSTTKTRMNLSDVQIVSSKQTTKTRMNLSDVQNVSGKQKQKKHERTYRMFKTCEPESSYRKIKTCQTNIVQTNNCNRTLGEHKTVNKLSMAKSKQICQTPNTQALNMDGIKMLIAAAILYTCEPNGQNKVQAMHKQCRQNCFVKSARVQTKSLKSNEPYEPERIKSNNLDESRNNFVECAGKQKEKNENHNQRAKAQETP